MMTDPIADFLTHIRNASFSHKKEALIPFSKTKYALAGMLQKNGYVDGFEKVEKKGSFPILRVALKYRGKNPAITNIERVSKPGRRVYIDYNNIPFVLSGIGISIVSTSQGVMTGREARRRKIGGELICKVW